MPHEAPSADGQGWRRGKQFCPLSADTLHAIGESLNLTERELQIVGGLFDGKREDTIALELGISRFTVHTHLGRLYKKLDVDCCTGLLLRIFREYVALDPRVSDSVIASRTEPRSLGLGGTF